MNKILFATVTALFAVFGLFADLPSPAFEWDGEGGTSTGENICGKEIFSVSGGKNVALENIPAKNFSFSMFVQADRWPSWQDICGFADEEYQFKLEVNDNAALSVYGSEAAGLYGSKAPVFVEGFCASSSMRLLTYVQSEGSVKIYVDGVLRTTTYTTQTWNALLEGDSKMSYFAWGCAPTTNGGKERAFNLNIADVRIYDTALLGSQVAELWESYYNLTKVTATAAGLETSLSGLGLEGGENTLAEITLADGATFTIDGAMTFKRLKFKSTGNASIVVAENALANIGSVDCSGIEGYASLKFETIGDYFAKVLGIDAIKKIGDNELRLSSSHRVAVGGKDFYLDAGSVVIESGWVMPETKNIIVDGSDAVLRSIANDPFNEGEDYAKMMTLLNGGVFSSDKHARLPANTVFSGQNSKLIVNAINNNEWCSIAIRNVTVEDNSTAFLERSEEMRGETKAGFHLWNSVFTVGENSKMTISAPLLKGCDGNGQRDDLTSLTKSGSGELVISAPESGYKLPSSAVISIQEGALVLDPTTDVVDLGSAAIAISEGALLSVAPGKTVALKNNISGAGQIKIDGASLNVASCDISGFTGSFNFLNNATLVMAAGTEGTMSVPEGSTLKLVLSQAQKDSGYVSKANTTVVFLDTDGATELTEGVNGNEYTTSTPCWTPTSSNQNLSDPTLWNRVSAVTSGEVLLNCSQVGDISVEMPESANFSSVTVKGANNNTVKLVYKEGRNHINGIMRPVITLDGAKVVLVIDATAASVQFNSDWRNYIRTSGYTFAFRGADGFGVSLEYGVNVNEAIQSHLVFESGTHAMSYGYGGSNGESNFGEGATPENPTVMVENGAVLNLTGKDLSCWSGSANNKGIMRVNNGGRLNILGSGGSTCYYRQQFYLEPGAILDASGVRSNYFRLQGGSGEDASPVIYVPASDAGDELPARIIASTGIYLANDQTIGFKVQVEEGSKLLIDGNIAAAGTSEDFIVRKVGAGNLEITGSIAPKIIVNGGKVVFGGDVANGYMTNVAGMHIKGGEARISASDRGVGGSIVVDKGATLVLNSTDVINYSGTTELHVYGTFDGTNQRQSLGSNNKVYFYDGAYLKGAGGNNYYSGYTAVFDVIANSVFVVEGNVYVDAVMGISGDLTFKSQNGGVVYMANPVSTKGTAGVGVDNVVMLIASSAQSGKTATIPEGSWGAQYKLNEGVTVEFVEGRLVFNAPALAPEIVLAQGMAFAQTGSAGPLTVLNGAAVMVDGNPVANYTAKATANVLKFVKPAFVIRVR